MNFKQSILLQSGIKKLNVIQKEEETKTYISLCWNSAIIRTWVGRNCSWRVQTLARDPAGLRRLTPMKMITRAVAGEGCSDFQLDLGLFEGTSLLV